MALIDTIYKFLARIRIGFSSLVALFLLMTPVLAQESPPESIKESIGQSEATAEEQISADAFEDPYLVENIEADATAENAVMAREKAFQAAQIKGYEELAKRFLSEEDLKTFKVPALEKIEPFVQDFEVTNEKLSLTRYKGVYNIRYATNTFKTAQNDDIADDALAPQGIELLVLPFLESNGRTYLWQINPFWEAWKRAQSKKVLGKITVPLGNTDDVSAVRDGQGLRYDPATLNAMRIRYKAKNAAILVATPEVLPDNTINVSVALYNAKPYGPELSRQLSIRAYPGEATAQLYNRVVATTAQALHQQWERTTAVTAPNFPAGIGARPVDPLTPAAPSLSGAPNMLVGQLQFSNARQWVEAKKAIEAIGGVKTLQIKSLSSRSATLEINFVGSVDAFRSALFQQGVRLNNAPTDGIYQLVLLRR